MAGAAAGGPRRGRRRRPASSRSRRPPPRTPRWRAPTRPRGRRSLPPRGTSSSPSPRIPTPSSRWSACSIRAARRCPASPRREAVPGEKLQLRVTPSRPLADGVYTVNWRVVSAVDGHVETGAFAFGVGEKPAPGSEVVVELLHTSPWVSAMATAGKWLLYVGLVLLVGAASTSLLVYGGRLPAGGITGAARLRHRRDRRSLPDGLVPARAGGRAEPASAVPHPGGQAPARPRRRLARLRRRRGRRGSLAGALEPVAARRRRGGGDARPRRRRPRRLAVVGLAAEHRRAMGPPDGHRRLGRRPVLAAARPARHGARRASRGRRPPSPGWPPSRW